jgi:hypothetical protein
MSKSNIEELLIQIREPDFRWQELSYEEKCRAEGLEQWCTGCNHVESVHVNGKCVFGPSILTPLRCVTCGVPLYTRPSVANIQKRIREAINNNRLKCSTCA